MNLPPRATKGSSTPPSKRMREGSSSDSDSSSSSSGTSSSSSRDSSSTDSDSDASDSEEGTSSRDEGDEEDRVDWEDLVEVVEREWRPMMQMLEAAGPGDMYANAGNVIVERFAGGSFEKQGGDGDGVYFCAGWITLHGALQLCWVALHSKRNSS